ncbi:MAG: hypothetical protein A2015_10985 [Spirochaetes bacterium GWF1_31_7]|nr:MAG: hypothetical protein A2Y30_13120 [Spirochaetes bacterium GWE1_32_154]OHD48382.1 MAG: hypothetical protein A2015_10985 [Spirochaetes bacterium GWF1_31_7]OHD50475.1 MAG: hypothetical protein A2Y29_11165 [Spirochaetes bacterium GWE2_31_10]OHD82657.1 MAG: hypothetical protein A2355_15145 [Spirochaetes bacterium RIFOXYB1_FULL_32_8]HBD93234.1 hypothetical protein [Spirochaetia bacterium]
MQKYFFYLEFLQKPLQIIFLEEVKNELADTVNYDNNQNNGLEYEFAVEVKITIDRIIQYPDA